MSTDTTRPERTDRHNPHAVFLTFGVSLLLVGASLILADRRSRAVVAAERETRAEERRAICLESGKLFVPRIEGPLPMADPRSELWALAGEKEIPLERQTVAMPMLEAATIATVRLRGLTDGRHIAWRLSWRDDTVDANVDTARFTDAVALQFPITRNAAFTMGDVGQRVQILHWKALWQKDVDEHFQDVQDLHPNYWADLYWFAEGRPYTVPASFTDPRSHAWFAAYSAGNPMSDFNRAIPVEELVAEGYGTLTSQPESVSVGRGTWVDGEWTVVLARPRRTDDELDYQFGTWGDVGIAVWDGAGGNVGGRKHWSDWIQFEVSP